MLPEGFVKLIKSYGSPDFVGLFDALEGEPSVSVRSNRRKASVAPFQGAEPVPWCPDGYLLKQRPRFTSDPRLHQGLYYVQDSSSMIVSHIVRTILPQLAPGSRPVLALDACAAPGGKTTLLADELPAGSVIVANEFSPLRAAVLHENVAKWGNPYVRVTQRDAADFSRYPGLFDLILVDAPCSGEGMMRKEPVARQQWSENLVAQCARSQRQILDAVWTALRPGGFLIYSTCTFNIDENENAARYIVDSLHGENVAIPVPSHWAISPSLDPAIPSLRFIPGKTPGEGLFAAVFRKPDADPPAPYRDAKRTIHRPSPSKTPKIPLAVEDWLTASDAKITADGKGSVFAEFPSSRVPAELTPRLLLGTEKGAHIMPSQELALSLVYRRGAFPESQVDIHQALSYLKGQALQLPDSTPRGYVLLTYLGHPLGFVKNVGSRANNLYPAPWRIRTL